METPQHQIRNFTLLGHIDHGKSTLADRLLQTTHTVPERSMRPQFLDKLTVERERGITIKLQTVRMIYHPPAPIFNFKLYILNLIDTPGHVDFSYEVSRSLAACEGAVLLVDATQGIQAQTLSNFYKAQAAHLKIIPVVNKIDLAGAQIQQTAMQLNQVLGFPLEEILYLSAKTGEGIEKLLDEIVKRIPPPSGQINSPLRALIFDSFYHEHQGVIALVKVVDGEIRVKDKELACAGRQKEKMFLMHAQVEFEPAEVGFVTASFTPTKELLTGEVGYIATGIKQIQKVRVGETITKIKNQKSKIKNDTVSSLPGYQKAKPMVFANLFPLDQSEYQGFRTALEKLSLNDASLTLSPASSRIFGFGFRGGFLGGLHLEITRERLWQEFAQETIITNPTVDYHKHQEPWVRASIYAPDKFLGSILELCQNKRGVYQNVAYLLSGRMSLIPLSNLVRAEYELPLAELVNNFYDRLKSISSGFASLDYEFLGYKEADLVKVKILVNQQEIEELSITCVRDKATETGRGLIEKLEKLIPRQQFKIPLQAAINGKILARADIPALRKDVTAKLYGGDRTRKDKLLEKQRQGKARLKKFGRVEIPPEVFLQILRD